MGGPSGLHAGICGRTGPSPGGSDQEMSEAGQEWLPLPATHLFTSQRDGAPVAPTKNKKKSLIEKNLTLENQEPLRSDPSRTARRHWNLPTTNEVAVAIPGDGTRSYCSNVYQHRRDVSPTHKSSSTLPPPPSQTQPLFGISASRVLFRASCMPPSRLRPLNSTLTAILVRLMPRRREWHHAHATSKCHSSTTESIP